MRKFKKIAAGAAAGEPPLRRPARRRFLAGLTTLGLAGATLAAGRVRANRPPDASPLAEAFTWAASPIPVPDTAFLTADGGETTLAAFRGRTVLLNFWATWCAPCVREMPSLDRLQARLKGEGLEVVAVSEDFAGIDLVQPFFKRLKLETLEIFLDDRGALAKAFGIAGLPTTLLIDRAGRMVGGLEGPAEWDSDDAVALIRHYLRQPGDGPEQRPGDTPEET